MPNIAPDTQEIVESIRSFINDRFDKKIKFATEDQLRKSAESWREKHKPENWLPESIKCLRMVQKSTHIAKGVHPQASGSNLYADLGEMPEYPVVGSFSLGKNFLPDITGAASVGGSVSFVNMEISGRSLEAICKESADSADAVTAALCVLAKVDEETAKNWVSSIADFSNGKRCGRPVTDGKEKQVYWCAENPLDENSFFLLNPLYPSSLMAAVCEKIESDLFSDKNKNAREDRKKGLYNPDDVISYPDYCLLKMGGSNPQNISKFVSSRNGKNYLLASLPPAWDTKETRPLFFTKSLFRKWGGEKEVRETLQKLQDLLQKDLAANMHTRRKRDNMVHDLLDYLLEFILRYREIPTGWTDDSRCTLPDHQKAVLDYQEESRVEWVQPLAQDFAKHINSYLRDNFPVGDPEYLYWYSLAENYFSYLTRECVL